MTSSDAETDFKPIIIIIILLVLLLVQKVGAPSIEVVLLQTSWSLKYFSSRFLQVHQKGFFTVVFRFLIGNG